MAAAASKSLRGGVYLFKLLNHTWIEVSSMAYFGNQVSLAGNNLLVSSRADVHMYQYGNCSNELDMASIESTLTPSSTSAPSSTLALSSTSAPSSTPSIKLPLKSSPAVPSPTATPTMVCYYYQIGMLSLTLQPLTC